MTKGDDQVWNAQRASVQAEPARHSTKENGDCPHWCKACKVEAAERAAHPKPAAPATPVKATAEGAPDVPYLTHRLTRVLSDCKDMGNEYADLHCDFLRDVLLALRSKEK